MGNLIWVILILILLALAAWLYIRRTASASRLVYILLPPYEIPDVIIVGGIVVENHGYAAAPNVKVAITYDDADSSKIHHMHVESDEPYILRGGGEQYHFATIRLRELGAGKKVFVYWAAGDRVQPQVSVTSFQPSYNYLFTRRGEVWANFFRRLTDRQTH